MGGKLVADKMKKEKRQILPFEIHYYKPNQENGFHHTGREAPHFGHIDIIL
jgi:hypothetical protein